MPDYFGFRMSEVVFRQIDAEPPTVACQYGHCVDCPDPLDCTCTCHIDAQEVAYGTPEARDAAAEQAHESRYGLHRDGTADND